MSSATNKEWLSQIPMFFIVGRSRSGTTLLRTLFDAHPNVIMPFESPFIWVLRNKYGKRKYWTKKHLTSFYHDLYKTNWKFKLWPVDKEKLLSDLLSLEGKTDYLTVCKCVHANYISTFQKKEIKWIGDKNPKYSIRLKTIEKMFPEVRYVHIIRDYRDHLYSMLKVNFLGSVIPEILYQWKYSARTVESFRKKNPEKIISIRYEELAKEPERVFGEICRFLNIPYEPSVLDFYKHEQEIKNSLDAGLLDKFQKSLFNPINTGRIKNWEGKLNEQIIKMADTIVGKYAERNGYERIYKKTDIQTVIRIIPRITIIRLYYLYRWTIGIFPSEIKAGIKRKLPSLPRLYFAIFPQDKKQFDGEQEKFSFRRG